MALTDQQRDRIVQAVKAKFDGKKWTCPLCGDEREPMVVPSGIIPIPLQTSLDAKDALGNPQVAVSRSDQNLPSVGLVCRNCGDTRLLNGYVLGLADLIGMSTSAQRKAEAEAAQKAKAATPDAEAKAPSA